MMRYLLPALVVGMTLISAGKLAAQNPAARGGPYAPRPAVSPYINLLRPGSSTALNYYGLVRPQFDTLAGFQAVQQRFGQLQTGIQTGGGESSDGFLMTGHAASFMNYGGYFMTTNVGAGMSAIAPGATRRVGPSNQPTPTSNLAPRAPQFR
jgi:hypothetical protein